MKKITTIYACDGCGKSTKDSKALRSFNLVHRSRTRRDDQWSDNADLCDKCEARLIEAVEPILGSGVVELRRLIEAPKSKAGAGKVAS